ncbi:hypothetical protein Tco_0457453, partial [Tanacetum coccineum]
TVGNGSVADTVVACTLVVGGFIDGVDVVIVGITNTSTSSSLIMPTRDMSKETLRN